MTNKRENPSFFSIHPSRRPDPNNDKVESTRLNNLLVKKNNVTIKRDQEKFNDAGTMPDMINVHVGHASAHNEGGLMRTEDSGRERLKRHRIEVAGHVWIPEIWGQEELLKDWIDCSAFDSKLMNNNNIMSARAALVEERRRTNSSCRLRIENSY
uniref:Protein BIC1 n=1 Tax=Solanum tuberosum TaxID=4113 RepID=M0ZS28_SOLTU